MFAELNIQQQDLPTWTRQDMPLRVPLPPWPGRAELPGRVVAWTQARGQERVALLSEHDGAMHCRYDLGDWLQFVLFEDYRTLRRPLFTRLPFHYHRIPAMLRNVVAGRVLARNGSAEWSPIEQGFAVLHDIMHDGTAAMELDHPGVVLTHDIDTAEGFDWIPGIALLEMEHGLRSVWNVVAGHYPIDHEVLEWLVEQGFEIGLHGYNHDCRLAFLSEAQLHRRLQRCMPLIERYNMQHFRSPAWFRSDTMYRVLGDYVEHDYSPLDSDGFCPGGPGGCLWTRPFKRHGVTVWPTTLPVDELILLGCSPEDITRIWLDKIAWLAACGGCAVVNTHPDPHRSGNATMLAVYDELLTALAPLATRREAHELVETH